MATIDFAPEDFLDEIRTKDLVAELLRRRDASHDKFDPQMFSQDLTGDVAREMERNNRAAVSEFAREAIEFMKSGRLQDLAWMLDRELIRAETREPPIESRYAEYVRTRAQ